MAYKDVYQMTDSEVCFILINSTDHQYCTNPLGTVFNNRNLKIVVLVF